MEDTNRISVRFLGEFQLEVRGRSLTEEINRSKKMANLLAYLIYHRDSIISQGDLIRALWPDSRRIDPVTSLKTLIYRTRKLLQEYGFPKGSRSAIHVKNSTFRWWPQLPCEIDLVHFNALYDRCMAIPQDSSELPTQETLGLFQEAFTLYGGHFLMDYTYEPWVVPVQERYRRTYRALTARYLKLLMRAGEYESAVKTSRAALRLEPYDNFFHEALLRALAKLNRHQEAIIHYNQMSELYFRELGITPPGRINRLYGEIHNTAKTNESNLDEIMNELIDSNGEVGAFYCEYELFKRICKLYSRDSTRTGSSLMIALLSVNSTNSEPLPANTLTKIMRQLQSAIQKTIRKSDVLSRYSQSQFIMLLPVMACEDGELVTSRIISRFNRDHPHKNFEIVPSVRPLDFPNGDQGMQELLELRRL